MQVIKKTFTMDTSWSHVYSIHKRSTFVNRKIKLMNLECKVEISDEQNLSFDLFNSFQIRQVQSVHVCLSRINACLFGNVIVSNTLIL